MTHFTSLLYLLFDSVRLRLLFDCAINFQVATGLTFTKLPLYVCVDFGCLEAKLHKSTKGSVKFVQVGEKLI